MKDYVEDVDCPATFFIVLAIQIDDTFYIDVEVIDMKLFSYFSIYIINIWIELLKDFVIFVGSQYSSFLLHSEAHWHSLTNTAGRVLS